jgi:predicted AlkP superfamily phosphohydrolase/phosphomutase
VAYIGPGAGFAFLGSFLTLSLAILAGLTSLLIWPFRSAWLLFRRRRAAVKKLIFLGFDGLDPRVTERLMAEGKLPNFSRLRAQGGYRRLRTTFPALSPVAWSTFATGVNPGKHNIFDFLNRDLRTYAPELSSAKVRRDSVEMRRKSETFWKILGRHAVTSTILRVPITFPPEEFNGRLLSAMCTPDLRGTQGTFSRFDAPVGELEGPEGETIGFRVKGGVLFIEGERFELTRGEYTPWIRLKFATARGIVRFLLVHDESNFSLYATPVQIDPEDPALPISHPRCYAIYLAKLLGSFSTLGMAEDTWALNEGAIDQTGFLQQARLIQDEREAMFFGALDHTRHGVVACVFDTSDRVQHMCYTDEGVIENMYRDMDRVLGRALAYAGPGTALFVLSDHGFTSFRRGVNLNTWLLREGYLALKDESGDYFEAQGPPGAAPENGGTRPSSRDSAAMTGASYLDGIDWSRTRAYTFGLGGVYLNLKGREAQGVVEPAQADALRREIAGKLSGLRDDETGDLAIVRAWEAPDLYRGPYLGAAPDLIVGYAEGYRASWDAAVGKVSSRVFEDNAKAWCGDHCVDPALVPGVLFSNLPIAAEDPGIEDMAPTALGLFGVPVPAWMEGKSVV